MFSNFQRLRKMKIVIICILTFLAFATSSPVERTTLKRNEAFFKCANICIENKDAPLCATDGIKLNLSFANECALQKYNCEHNKILTKKSDKACPNSNGIRLS